MKVKKQFKYYITYYYIDNFDTLFTGYSFIWSTSELKAHSELRKLAYKKHLFITNILSCEIVDERED